MNFKKLHWVHLKKLKYSHFLIIFSAIQWYFVSKIDLTYCEKTIVLVIEKKLLKFEAEGQEVAKLLRSLEQFILTGKSYNNF